VRPDNPFAQLPDADETVAVPRVPPRAVAAAPLRESLVRDSLATPAVAPALDESTEQAFALGAPNPLVGAAYPLLWLAARVDEDMRPDDVEAFRERVLAELRRFENAAITKGVSNETVRVARYVLAAMLDDLVLNTEWGRASAWPSRGLVSSLFNETWGGERFFDLLAQLMADPVANADALELMAICIAAGFVGKYRVSAGGTTQLARLRDDLHRVLRRVRGAQDRELSPSWRGLDEPYRPPAIRRLPWIVAGVALALLLLVYGVLSLSLRAQVDATTQRLQAALPSKPVVVPTPAPPAAPAPIAAPAPKPQLTQLQRIQRALAADIDAKRAEIFVEPSRIGIRLIAADLFQSGRDTLGPDQPALIERIGKVLDKEPGRLLVTGHTDSTPIVSAKFPTNLVLSEARAKTVAEALRTQLADPKRVAIEGKADTVPLASNATIEGRARNRRVEIELPRTDKNE
jgi:type VI secretion system protein ImpK